MAPVPVWAKALALLVAAATAPVMAALVLAAGLTMASTSATSARTTTFGVGPEPRLRVDSPFAVVRIEPGPDGRIVVDHSEAASSLTRAGAEAALRQTAVHASRQGDLVTIGVTGGSYRALALSHDSTITIHVPVHTDLDIGQGGSEVTGIDGIVSVRGGAGSVTLREVTLRGGSRLDVTAGDLSMRDVRVAGSAVVRAGAGAVRFDGTLAPGGSSLDIDDTSGAVRVALPRPTDARAAVATQLGELHADPAWGFRPDNPDSPRRWTADLGPEPTGTVTVRAALGNVEFAVR